jgi:hypothetical protein
MIRRHLRNAIWIFAEDTRIMGWENVFAFPLQLSQSRHCVRHVIQEAGRDLCLSTFTATFIAASPQMIAVPE